MEGRIPYQFYVEPARRFWEFLRSAGIASVTTGAVSSCRNPSRRQRRRSTVEDCWTRVPFRCRHLPSTILLTWMVTPWDFCFSCADLILLFQHLRFFLPAKVQEKSAETSHALESAQSLIDLDQFAALTSSLFNSWNTFIYLIRLFVSSGRNSLVRFFENSNWSNAFVFLSRV